MNEEYKFKDEILEAAFDMVDEYIDEPIKDHEFTAKDMAERYPQYGQRHWLNKLDDAVKDDVLKSRRVKGGGKAYWIPEQPD